MKPILQVEDDPNDVYFLRHACKKAGIENAIQVAADGQNAIDYLKGVGRYADRALFPLPCLVLLDLKLPYVMGLDVLEWIRSQALEFIPVVILSASAEAGDIAASYRLGANAFLTKPSEAGKLEDTVKAIKQFWLVHNMLPPENFTIIKDPLALSATSSPARNLKIPLHDCPNGEARKSKPSAVHCVPA